MLISGSPIDAYLIIDSYTTAEKLIADYILQDSAQVSGEKTDTSTAVIICFSHVIFIASWTNA